MNQGYWVGRGYRSEVKDTDRGLWVRSEEVGAVLGSEGYCGALGGLQVRNEKQWGGLHIVTWGEVRGTSKWRQGLQVVGEGHHERPGLWVGVSGTGRVLLTCLPWLPQGCLRRRYWVNCQRRCRVF